MGVTPPAWHGISKGCFPVIRITIQPEQSHTVVTIAGQLATPDVTEVRRVRQSVRGKVILKLSGLDACAEEGIRLLRAWLNAGAQLDSATPFLRMVLQDSKAGDQTRKADKT
jgi:hypothetical protein